MAEGKRRDEWDRTCQLFAWVAEWWSGKPVDARAMNPYRRGASEADVAESEEAKAAQSKLAWAEMHEFFRGGVWRHGNQG